jgi:hypothetical protein
MLDRHPGLAICGETYFQHIVYQPRQRRAFGDLREPGNRQRLVDEYLATRRIEILRMDRDALGEKLQREGTSYPAFFAALLQYYAESRGKPRWGEKTPQHAFFAETLCEWFPGAVILHMVRDPRDVVASLQRMPFGSGSAVLNARTWLKCNLAARRSSHRTGYLEVRYEALVTRPEQALKRVCAFIGEEYCSSMLTAEQDAMGDPIGKDRYKTPLTTQRMGLWRNELTTEQVALIEWVVGAQMEQFGYVREAARASAATITRGLGKAAAEVARIALPILPAAWYYFTAPGSLRKYEYWRHSEMRPDLPPARITEEESAR